MCWRSRARRAGDLLFRALDKQGQEGARPLPPPRAAGTQPPPPSPPGRTLLHPASGDAFFLPAGQATSPAPLSPPARPTRRHLPPHLPRRDPLLQRRGGAARLLPRANLDGGARQVRNCHQAGKHPYDLACSGCFGSYMLPMDQKTNELIGTDYPGNRGVNVKNHSLSWMVGFMFVASFLSLLSLFVLCKVMVFDYELTYPSGAATAMSINSFHTTTGAEACSDGSVFLFNL